VSVAVKGGERMIESLASKEERHQVEGLSLQELEGQTVELLPNRIEMRRRRRRTIIIINCAPATAIGALATATANC
jgi:hypothetical protein